MTRRSQYTLTDDGARIVNGPSVFNRPLYGTNSPGMLHAGDKPFLAFDLHTAGGKAGNALFAVLGKRKSRWLHDAARIEFTYIPGRCRYAIQDPLLGSGTLRIDVVPLDRMDGFVVRLDSSELKSPKELMFFFGGGSGVFVYKYGKQLARAYGEPDTFDPALDFAPAHCERNILQLGRNGFTMLTASGSSESLQATRSDFLPDPAPGPKTIAGAASACGSWHAGNANRFRRGPQSLASSRAGNRPVALFRWHTEEALVQHVVVAAGGDCDVQKLATAGERLFRRCCRHFDRLSRTAEIQTPEADLDMSFRAHVIALDGAYEPPFVHHGAQSWRGPYLGWRGCHGFDAIGWHERVRANLLAHAEHQLQDHPYFYGLLPSVYKGKGSFFEMSQVFLDMLLYNYEWTGDLSMMKAILPRLHRVIAAENRLYDSDNDFLYTNKLNYFITDAHWFYGGPCPEASAYMYRAFRALAAVLKKLKRPCTSYEERREGIRKAMNDVLWLQRKGHFAQYKDVLGLQRIHEEAELSAIYHPIEFGVTNMFQSYQQLRYVETHMDSCRWGDGLIYWSSNWMPAHWDGDCFRCYTSRSLAPAENFNLALACYRIRQSETGYRLLRGGVYASYNSGYPLAMGYTVTTNAKAYHAVDFTDVTSTYIRAIVEGLFGVRPNLSEKEIVLEPNLPAHWDQASLRTLDLRYSYRRRKNVCALTIETKKKIRKRFRIAIRAREIVSVKINGRKSAFRTEPGIGCTIVEAKGAAGHKSTIRVATSEKAPSVAAPKRVKRGQKIRVPADGGSIRKWLDPQAVLQAGRIGKLGMTAQISDDHTSGHHTFFVLIDTGRLSCWLPVDFEIKDTREPAVSFAKPGKKSRQEPVDISSFYTHSLNSVFQETYAGPRALNEKWAHRIDGLPSHIVRTNPLLHLRREADERWTVDESHFRSRLGNRTEFATGDGVRFRVSPAETRAAFISRWDAFDPAVAIPLGRRDISRIYILTAGTTEVMQSHIENVRLLARYEDGGQEVLDLVNPFNYDDSIGAFGYQHTAAVPMVRLSESAHLDVYSISLDASRVVTALEAEVLSQGIIFGIVAITLEA